MRSPITWYGGKGMMVAKLLPLIPPHHTYVEPYCGGASLFWAKRPSAVEVLNDLDGHLVNFYRVLRDATCAVHLQELLELTPYSRAERDACLQSLDEACDSVEAARRFFVACRQGFSGKTYGGGWGYCRTHSIRGMAGHVNNWRGAVSALHEAARRSMDAQIECRDGLDVIRRFDTPETFFYCDPPYVGATREKGSRQTYLCELRDEEHSDLVERLLCIEGMAAVSGYRHRRYRPLEEAGWCRIDFDVACMASGRTRLTGYIGEGTVKADAMRVESVWLCPRTAQAVRGTYCATEGTEDTETEKTDGKDSEKSSRD